MDPTVECLWTNRFRRGVTIELANWAIRLLEMGTESDAILRLTDRNLHWQDQQRLMREVLADLGPTELLEPMPLRDAYEREIIGDYFAGQIDGWTVMERGCELYWENPKDDPGREFWIRVAEDAHQHGGQDICTEYPLHTGDFDEVLKSAILSSGRPLPDGA